VLVAAWEQKSRSFGERPVEDPCQGGSVGAIESSLLFPFRPRVLRGEPHAQTAAHGGFATAFSECTRSRIRPAMSSVAAGCERSVEVGGHGRLSSIKQKKLDDDAAGQSHFSTLFYVAAIGGKSPRTLDCMRNVIRCERRVNRTPFVSLVSLVSSTGSVIASSGPSSRFRVADSYTSANVALGVV